MLLIDFQASKNPEKIFWKSLLKNQRKNLSFTFEESVFTQPQPPWKGFFLCSETNYVFTLKMKTFSDSRSEAFDR